MNSSTHSQISVYFPQTEPTIVSLGCGFSIIASGLSGWATNFHTPSGQYLTSRVGNTFPGNSGPNGFGYWGQNGADKIEVTAQRRRAGT
jgi:hypothetical protein